jgi:hypothetical protein
MKIAVTIQRLGGHESAECRAIPAKTKDRLPGRWRTDGAGSVTYDGAVEIVGVSALDLYGGDLADPERPTALDEYGAVDLGRIALAATLCGTGT